jgi:nucleoside-diphosphate kinase
MDAMERTFLMIKPDGVQRGLVGEIIGRFERKGFQLAGMKLMRITRELAERHYAEHAGKPFYESLISFITSGPVVAMVWRGDGVIAQARAMMGKTNPQEAAPGTIRGDYGVHTGFNLIHGSDSPESAEREIRLFFRDEELVDYARALDAWI